MRFRVLIAAFVAAFFLMDGSSGWAKPTRRRRGKAAKVKKRKRRRKPRRSAPETPSTSAQSSTSRAAARGATPPSAKADEDNRALQRGERVEFDARLIQGQTAKAGAVYLFERVGSNLRSMVRERHTFFDEIVRPVFPKTRSNP